MSDERINQESINQESIKGDKSLYIEFHIQNYLNKVGKFLKIKLLDEKKSLHSLDFISDLWSVFLQSCNGCSTLCCRTKTEYERRGQKLLQNLKTWLYTEAQKCPVLSLKDTLKYCSLKDTAFCWCLIKYFPSSEVNLCNYFNTVMLLLPWCCNKDQLCA